MFRNVLFNTLTFNTEFSLETCVVSYHPASCKCSFPSQDKVPLLDYISLICACGWRLFVEHLIILAGAKRSDRWVWTIDKERTLRLLLPHVNMLWYLNIWFINQNICQRKYFLEKIEIKNCKNIFPFFFLIESFCLVKLILSICFRCLTESVCIRF